MLHLQVISINDNLLKSYYEANKKLISKLGLEAKKKIIVVWIGTCYIPTTNLVKTIVLLECKSTLDIYHLSPLMKIPIGQLGKHDI